MPVHRHPVATSKGGSPLSKLPLDRALVHRLEASFAPIRDSGLRFGEIFYAKLFAAAPQLRPLFRSDPQAQTEKLVASLDAIVRNLLDPDENAAMLAALGKRHAGYGVKPGHYDLVIELLIESMREVLGPSAHGPSLDEWRLALRLVSDQMIAAAESPPDDAAR
jgi:hemoglobin-like flavoprotein